VVKTSLLLSDRQHVALTAIAEQEGLPFSEIIRWSIERFLEARSLGKEGRKRKHFGGKFQGPGWGRKGGKQ
jgi:hypothetical protein